MSVTKVQYTVKDEYVETNKRNIKEVMKELRALNNSTVFYDAYLLDDGKTFMHIAGSKDGQPGDVIGKLASFKVFREGL